MAEVVVVVAGVDVEVAAPAAEVVVVEEEEAEAADEDATAGLKRRPGPVCGIPIVLRVRADLLLVFPIIVSFISRTSGIWPAPTCYGVSSGSSKWAEGQLQAIKLTTHQPHSLI